MSPCIVGASAEDVYQLLVLLPMRLGDWTVDDRTFVGVQSECERGVSLESIPPTVDCEAQRVRQRDVGQRVCRGVGHRARHIGYAIEHRVVDPVCRLGVSSWPAVFEAAALVDG